METTSANGIIYDIAQLEDFANQFPIIEVSIDHFIESVSPAHQYWTDDHGQQIGPSDILNNWPAVQQLPQFKQHIDSIMRADLTKPIWVLSTNNQVIDGMHRLTKAFLDHQPTIKIRYLDSLPKTARILST